MLARRYLDRRPWEALGLATPGTAWRQFLWGMAIWLCAAGVGLLLALVAGVEFSLPGSPDREFVLLTLALPFLVFLYEALPEELVFRGYFSVNLASRIPRWLAVIAQAVLFVLWGALIDAAGSDERIIVFFTFSLILGILRALTGAIWAGIGYHVAFQWVTQWLVVAIDEGHVRVSDQDTLSILAFWLIPIVLLSVALAIWSIWKKSINWRAREPDLPLAAAVQLN